MVAFIPALRIWLKIQRPSLPHQPLLQIYLFSQHAAFAHASSSRKTRIGSLVTAQDLTPPDELFQPLPGLNTAGPHTAILVETHLIQLWGVNAMKPIPGILKGQTMAVMNNDLGSQGRLHSHENQYDSKCPHGTAIPSQEPEDPIEVVH